jgi:hypothetical protein
LARIIKWGERIGEWVFKGIPNSFVLGNEDAGGEAKD